MLLVSLRGRMAERSIGILAVGERGEVGGRSMRRWREKEEVGVKVVKRVKVGVRSRKKARESKNWCLV